MDSKWLNKLERHVRQISDMQVPVYAANACFFLTLSVFPMLLLVLASLRYTRFSAGDLIALLGNVLPEALMGAAERLIVSTYYNASGAVVSVSALAALRSASRGIYGLLTGLNNVYGVREDRGFFYRRGISVAYTFAFLLVLLLTLVLQVFGRSLLTTLLRAEGPVAALLTQIIDLRFLLLLGVQILLFTAVYMVLPNRRNSFGASLPGAAVAAVGWQVFSNLFSVYVDHFRDYANIYGSVYAMALGMLWLYFCMLILLFGGVLNRVISRWEQE